MIDNLKSVRLVTEILEENHYYPFGLTHKGYNDEHFIFLESPGTGIQLVPVTPDLTDTYKYKFGGKEWQDELDLNYYDFGARNYDAALVRTFTPDPMAEVYYELSPYSFLNNNPISNIDPTGAVTLEGQEAKDWLQNKKDEIASKPRKRKEEDEEFYEDDIKVKENRNISLDGGKCPDGDCGDLYQNYRNEFENNLRHKFLNNFTFEDAIWHYRLGKGMPVNVAASSLDFSSLSVEDFKNSDFTYQDHPLIYARLSDVMGIINNTNQALIYGTVGVVYLGEGTVMVLPDKYDFDIKFNPSLRGISRDLATILGQWYNGTGTSYYIQFEGTAKINNK